jgi:hypothetical protein
MADPLLELGADQACVASRLEILPHDADPAVE